MNEDLKELFNLVMARKKNPPEGSYTAKLFAAGRPRIAQKVGEEGVETAIASLSGGKEELVGESADLIFHLMVLWADAGVTPDDVITELNKRKKHYGNG